MVQLFFCTIARNLVNFCTFHVSQQSRKKIMVRFFPKVQLTVGPKKRIVPHKRKFIYLFYLITNFIPKYQPKNKMMSSFSNFIYIMKNK